MTAGLNGLNWQVQVWPWTFAIVTVPPCLCTAAGFPLAGADTDGAADVAALVAESRFFAEPEQADDAYRSFRSGERQGVNAPQTIADGLRGSIGVRNFELLRSHVDDVVTVSEQAIVEAMRVVLGDLKLLIEPSSAVPVAALLGGKFNAQARRVGIVLSGGNVDLEQCPFLRGAHR